MVPRGLEPRTLRLLAVRSNQLSYETMISFATSFNLSFQTKATHSLTRVAAKQETGGDACQLHLPGQLAAEREARFNMELETIEPRDK